MLLRRVEGNSMLPGIAPGSVVLAREKQPSLGDIVIARQAGREVIKRVESMGGGRYVLRGDNASESSDSREFGPVRKDDILGVVMIMLPTAVNPPAVRATYANWAGWVSAGVLATSAIIHLFRIDTFLPLLDRALPGEYGFAVAAGSVMVALEVFAVPFMLRMKLSPLMHIVSAISAIVVPLVWLLIAVWNYGFDISTAQLGEFITSKSGVPLLILNAAWLGYNLWSLWLLNFDVAFSRVFRR